MWQKNVSFLSSFEQVYKVHCLHTWQNFSTSTNLQYPINPDTDYRLTAPACLHNDSWMVSQCKICNWERCLKREPLGSPLILQLSSTQVSNPLSSITPLLTPGNNSSYIRKEQAVENVVIQQFEPLEAAVGQIRGGLLNSSSKFHGTIQASFASSRN